MDQSKPFSYLKDFFGPLFLMLNLMYLGSFFLSSAREQLLGSFTQKLDLLPLIKQVLLFLSLCLGLGFLWLCYKLSFEKLMKRAFLAYIALLSALALFLLPVYDYLQAPLLADQVASWLQGSVKEHFVEVFSALVRYWALTFFYATSLLFSPTISLVLVWGLANQFTKIKEAQKYYIALAFSASILVNVMAPFVYKLSLGVFVSTALSVFFLFFAWILSSRIFRKIPKDRIDEKPQEASQKWPLFSLGFFASSFVLTHIFYDLGFKMQLRQSFQSVEEYMGFVHQLTNVSMFFNASITALFLFLGPYLLKTKGWRFLALIPFLFVIAALFVDAFLQGNVWISSIPHIFIHGFCYVLTLALYQMVFLSIPQNSRFKAQIWIDLFIKAFFVVLGQASIVGVTVIWGSFSFSYGKIIVLILMLISMYFAISLGKRTPLPKVLT